MDALTQLTAGRALWELALVPMVNVEVEAKLCGVFQQSTLYQRVIALGSTQGAAAATPPAPGTAPPLLLTPAYMVAAGQSQNCTAILTSTDAQVVAAGLTNASALGSAIMQALQQCYLYDADEAEAQRCLFAMTVLGIGNPLDATVSTALLNATLAWLMSPPQGE